MIKFENTEVLGWEHAIRGMRNPMNSWEKSDSEVSVCECERWPHDVKKSFACLGSNDHDLMMRLSKGGPVHAKYRRMIAVYVDITAPLYWWKEFDTYKVGTVANSCSTMHKIADKEFTLEDFSHEHLIDQHNASYLDEFYYDEIYRDPWSPDDILRTTIAALNFYRQKYIETKSKPMKNEQARKELMKKYWWQMIQLLPSSFNQKRTVMMNYEVLANIYESRKNHKLDEWAWHEGVIDGDKTNKEYIGLCDWIETLPYSEIITTPMAQKNDGELRKYKEMFEELKKLTEEKYTVTACELCNIHGCGDSDEEGCKKCQFYKHSKWMKETEPPVLNEVDLIPEEMKTITGVTEDHSDDSIWFVPDVGYVNREEYEKVRNANPGKFPDWESAPVLCPENRDAILKAVAKTFNVPIEMLTDSMNEDKE